MQEIMKLTALQLGAAIRRGEVSPTEAVKAAKAPWDGAGLNMGALDDGSQWMVYLPPLPERFAAGPW